jgi:hypothetical protein
MEKDELIGNEHRFTFLIWKQKKHVPARRLHSRGYLSGAN